MFTIQYKDGQREDFNGSQRHLVEYLSHAQRPFDVIYEQVTIANKKIRNDLLKASLTTLSPAALEFINSPA